MVSQDSHKWFFVELNILISLRPSPGSSWSLSGKPPHIILLLTQNDMYESILTEYMSTISFKYEVFLYLYIIPDDFYDTVQISHNAMHLTLYFQYDMWYRKSTKFFTFGEYYFWLTLKVFFQHETCLKWKKIYPFMLR